MRLMGVLVAIVKADGVIEPKEVRMLRDCAARWRVPWRDVQAMLDSETDDSFGGLNPESPEQAQAFLGEMVTAAKIDGRVDRRERALIHRVAEAMGIDSESVDALIDA
jgi:tellurite resistance protein